MAQAWVSTLLTTKT